MFAVMISYSRHDLDQAIEMERQLKELGFSVWRDETNLHAGRSFDEEIEKAIGDASAVVVLYTDNAAQSDYVHKEMDFALEQNKLVCLRFGESEPPEAVMKTHILDFRDWKGGLREHCFDRLAASLDLLAGQGARQMRKAGGFQALLYKPLYRIPLTHYLTAALVAMVLTMAWVLVMGNLAGVFYTTLLDGVWVAAFLIASRLTMSYASTLAHRAPSRVIFSENLVIALLVSVGLVFGFHALQRFLDVAGAFERFIQTVPVYVAMLTLVLACVRLSLTVVANGLRRMDPGGRPPRGK